MPTCYFCMNAATHKKWVTVSKGRGQRVYIGLRGFKGLSTGGGSVKAVRGVCDQCADRIDRRSRWSTIMFCVIVASVSAFVCFGGYLDFDKHQPPKPIVWQDQSIK